MIQTNFGPNELTIIMARVSKVPKTANVGVFAVVWRTHCRVFHPGGAGI